MFKAIAIIFIVCFIYTGSCVSVDQVRQCIMRNCSMELSACRSEKDCTQCIDCLTHCEWDDEKCTHKCYDPVAKDETFWAVSLCGMTCMEELEKIENDDLVSCHVKECATWVKKCADDPICIGAGFCAHDCKKDDNVCLSKCVVESIENENFFNVIHCDATCLNRFVTK